MTPLRILQSLQSGSRRRNTIRRDTMNSLKSLHLLDRNQQDNSNIPLQRQLNRIPKSNYPKLL